MAIDGIGPASATPGEERPPAAEADLLARNSARLSTSRSIAWSLGGQVGTTILQMTSTIILARILTPDDFGAYAFATTIYALVQWLLQLGIGSFILREASLTRRTLNAAFAVALGQGLLATLIVIGAAPVAGWFARSATVGWVTLAVAITPFLASPEGVSDAMWLRNGRYAAIAFLQIGKLAVQTAVSVGAELTLHLGTWSLVLGLVASMTVAFLVGMASLLFEHGARPTTDREQWLRLRGFGGRTLLLTIAQIGSLRVPDLLIGRLLSLFVLGHYSRATNAIDVIGRTVSASVMRATSPRFYARVNEGEPLPRAVSELCDTLLFFVWPAAAGIAILGAPVVRLMYGPQWGLAAQALPLLCLAFAIDSARAGGMETLLIRDRLGLNTKIELVRAGYAILLVVLLARFGLRPVLWGRIAEACLTVLVYLFTMRRIGEVPLRGWLRIYGVNGLLAAAAAAPAAVLMVRWGWPEELDTGRFALAIGLGVLAWMAALLAIGHPLVPVARAMIDDRRGVALAGRN